MTVARKPVIKNVSKNSMEGVVKRISSLGKDEAGQRRSPHDANGPSKTDWHQLEGNSNPSANDRQLAHEQFALEQSDLKRLKELPREIGVMLMAAGVVGLILPGPGTPALIAGGLALWPGAFSKLELWLERRYPAAHQKSMKQISRFLDDLEKRYPHSRQG